MHVFWNGGDFPGGKKIKVVACARQPTRAHQIKYKYKQTNLKYSKIKWKKLKKKYESACLCPAASKKKLDQT